MSYRSLALAGALAVTLAATAHAAPIAAGSSIDINGSLQAIGGNGSVDTATGLHFLTVRTSSTASTQTGSFAGAFSTGLAGTFNDITSFSPLVAPPPLFSFTENGHTLSFTLTNLVSVVRTAAIGAIPAGLSVDGTGVFSFTGYEDTAAGYRVSTSGSGTTTFAASTLVAAAAVPEPASAALLGLGLLGIAAVRRRLS